MLRLEGHAPRFGYRGLRICEGRPASAGSTPPRHGASHPPNCVRDVETDIPVPGRPSLWHY